MRCIATSSCCTQDHLQGTQTTLTNKTEPGPELGQSSNTCSAVHTSAKSASSMVLCLTTRQSSLQACGMFLPWNLEARTYEMQSHALSIRSISSPFGFGCQFGDLSQSTRKRPALEFEDLGTVSELTTAQSSNLEPAQDQELQVLPQLACFSTFFLPEAPCPSNQSVCKRLPSQRPCESDSVSGMCAVSAGSWSF